MNQYNTERIVTSDITIPSISMISDGDKGSEINIEVYLISFVFQHANADRTIIEFGRGKYN